MVFSPIIIRNAGHGSAVNIALRRKSGNGRQLTVCVSLSLDVLDAIGVSVGEWLVPLLGEGADSNMLRLANDRSATGSRLRITAVKTGRSGKTTRGLVSIKCWMDARGVRLPATPCRYTTVHDSHVDIELPRELTSLPAIKIA